MLRLERMHRIVLAQELLLQRIHTLHLGLQAAVRLAQDLGLLARGHEPRVVGRKPLVCRLEALDSGDVFCVRWATYG